MQAMVATELFRQSQALLCNEQVVAAVEWMKLAIIPLEQEVQAAAETAVLPLLLLVRSAPRSQAVVAAAVRRQPAATAAPAS